MKRQARTTATRQAEAMIAMVALLAPVAATADDAVMYGNTPARNMASSATGVPTKFDPDSGLNVLWSMPLGSQSYAGPLYYDGMVFVGTNNELELNSKFTGDRGNLMAFDAATGKFLWQSAHAKLPAGRVNDWPLQGICSTPAVENGRVYYVSNRAEVICADAEGFRDGENDGPVTDEPSKTEIDEDVIWKYDMIGQLDVFPHNLAAGNPLLVGDLLFTVTGQGVDEGHVNIPSPAAPSFVALDKNTGELVWESALPGTKVLHGSWSNPGWIEFDGKGQVVFPGGDGVLYGFEPASGELIWQFDMNPADSVWELGGRGTRNNVISTPVVDDGLIYIGVGQDPEHGEGWGNFWVLDVAGKTGKLDEKAVVWHVGGEKFGRTLSTAAIHDGLTYIADLSGFVYCFDAKTGKLHWKYDTFAAIWGSPFYVDGKVFIGDEDGDLAVLKAGRGKDGEPELLHEVNMGASVYTTPVVHDGVMYVVSRNRLFALKEGIAPKKKDAPPTEKKG
ncbi:MAG TPA: PQQ-binding-like beta-propeller repeat protein [Candidatus Polarisedimenticolaceae bacterium]|nr:PQQ-binding-like beta-propeller repeat protein [Candidatus Polarisedimenticolaceae bacterium]